MSTADGIRTGRAVLLKAGMGGEAVDRMLRVLGHAGMLEDPNPVEQAMAVLRKRVPSYEADEVELRAAVRELHRSGLLRARLWCKCH